MGDYSHPLTEAVIHLSETIFEKNEENFRLPNTFPIFYCIGFYHDTG